MVYKNPSADDYVPMLNCLASGADLTQESEFERCAGVANLDFAAIKSCHDDNDLAWQLQVTNSELTPIDHTFTPWAVLNGDLITYGPDTNLLELVCEYYQGDDKPPACGTTEVTATGSKYKILA